MYKKQLSIIIVIILFLLALIFQRLEMILFFISVTILVSILFIQEKYYRHLVELTKKKQVTKTKTAKQETSEKNALNALLVHSLFIPLMIIDENGVVVEINKPFLRIIHRDFKEGVTYKQLFLLQAELLVFIESSLLHEKTKIVDIDIEQSKYQLMFSPLVLNGAFKGGAFILYDVTILKNYEAMQRMFIADASHELKTPITAISGSLEILKQDGFQSETVYQEFLDILIKEAKRMDDLVTDLSSLSKLSWPVVKLHFTSANINQLVKDIIVLHQSSLNKQINIHFESELQQDYLIDVDRFKQIINNLLSNSIRYTEYGDIQIILKESNHLLQISVIDTGIGIDEAHIPYVFDRFYRVNTDRARHSGGTGLGLSIVKSIVDLWGGKIEVKSRVNRGSTFKVMLPIHKEEDS